MVCEVFLLKECQVLVPYQSRPATNCEGKLCSQDSNGTAFKEAGVQGEVVKFMMDDQGLSTVQDLLGSCVRSKYEDNPLRVGRRYSIVSPHKRGKGPWWTHYASTPSQKRRENLSQGYGVRVLGVGWPR